MAHVALPLAISTATATETTTTTTTTTTPSIQQAEAAASNRHSSLVTLAGSLALALQAQFNVAARNDV